MRVRPVTDAAASRREKIANAAEVIGQSKDRKKVFRAIYAGKKKVKTRDELVASTKLGPIRVVQEAGVLFDNDIVNKFRIGRRMAYEKYSFYSQNKEAILRLAGNKKAIEKYPTKFTPRSTISVGLRIPRDLVRVKHVTIDDIDSFSKVHRVHLSAKSVDLPLGEKKFKIGLQKIIGEKGTFQDWGGEPNDLFSTRVMLKGRRVSAALGLKGKGTKGVLFPRMMGKRGDQILRLFSSPAELFLVQYWNRIDESIVSQMRQSAIAKSWSDHKLIYYGIIDGQDTQRILIAYRPCFS